MKRIIIALAILSIIGLLISTPINGFGKNIRFSAFSDNEESKASNKDAILEGTVIRTFHKFVPGSTTTEMEDAIKMIAKIQDNLTKDVYESLPLDEPLRVGDIVKFKKIENNSVVVIKEENKNKLVNPVNTPEKPSN